MKEFRDSARDGLREQFPDLNVGEDLPPLPPGFVLPPPPPGFVPAR